tara:strand:- start:136 stop:333 length:198 start_codon:yes stop_codon:yes gene_type:complete
MKDVFPGDLVQSLFDNSVGLVLEVEPIEYEEEYGASWIVVLWSNNKEIVWVERDCIKLINRAEIN